MSALYAVPGFAPQVEPPTIPWVQREHMGGDAPPSEIQFLRRNGNIHSGCVYVCVCGSAGGK